VPKANQENQHRALAPEGCPFNIAAKTLALLLARFAVLAGGLYLYPHGNCFVFPQASSKSIERGRELVSHPVRNPGSNSHPDFSIETVDKRHCDGNPVGDSLLHALPGRLLSDC